MTDTIIAVYVHRYRHIGNSIVQFGSDNHCTLDENGLTIRISQSGIPPRLYFGDGIDGVGVVVGKNGSGKSSLLELIAMALGTQGKQGGYGRGVSGLIIWSREELGIKATGPWLIYPDDEGAIQPPRLPNIEFNGQENIVIGDEFPQVNVVLASSLSAMANGRTSTLMPFQNTMAWCFDARSDSMLRSDFISECDSDDQHTSASSIEQFDIIRRFHATREKIRQLGFLSSIRQDPQRPQIFRDAFEADLVGLAPRTLVPSMLKARNAMPEELDAFAMASDPETGAGRLARVMCWSLIFEGTYHLQGRDRADEARRLWPRLPSTRGEASGDAYYRECLGTLFDRLKGLEIARVRDKARLWEMLTGRPDLIRFQGMREHGGAGASNRRLSIDIEDSSYFWFNSPSVRPQGVGESGIFQALSLYETAGKIAPFLDIEYGHFSEASVKPFMLSHGEDALLSLFGRLRHAEKIRNAEDVPARTTIAIMDEVDISFHPEWQRRFIAGLCFALPQIYEGNSVQALLSTHTPIVLSDIPHENHTRMSVSRTHPRESSSQSAKTRTIAANLYDLLNDEFYLGDEFIGDHAAFILGLIKADDPRTRPIALAISHRIADPILRMAFTSLVESRGGAR